MGKSASREELSTVGRNCYGYETEQQGFLSKSGDAVAKSCTNCKHLVNQKCDINLYDSVIANLDEK